MTQEYDNEHGALVLAPKPAARGTFALLVPDNICWEVSDFGGGYRLDFPPMTAAEQRKRKRERGELWTPRRSGRAGSTAGWRAA